MNLTPAERKILVDLLVHGDNLSGNIAEETGVTRSYVSELLGDLEDKGLVRNKGRGVYTLTLAGVPVARDLYRK